MKLSISSAALKGLSVKAVKTKLVQAGRSLRASTPALLTVVRGVRVPLALLFAGVLLQNLAALSPGLIERLYGRGVYPKILSTLSVLSRPFSFSLGELLVCLLLVLALSGVAAVLVLRLRSGVGGLRLVVGSAKFIAWLAVVLLWAFLFAFGLNYQRPPLYDLLGYERRRASAFELEELGVLMVRGVNQNYMESRADGRQAPGVDDLIALLQESFKGSRDLGLLPKGAYVAPKPVYFSGLLTRLGISGIYFPFTAEPNFNADMPDFQLPFSMAHEMAHQRGVARESEANFVAYLVCVNSRDPFVRYSGYRNGLGVLSELYRLEPERAKGLIGRLGPGFREDSRRAALFWAKAAGAAGALSYRVNDLYLRANRVRSGAEDYSGSTALIIGHHLHGRDRAGQPPAP